MDLWVVAALTGAGYAAKYLQNLPSREKEKEKEGVLGLTSTALVSKKPKIPSLIPEKQELFSSYYYGLYDGSRESLQCNTPTAEAASMSKFDGQYSDCYGAGIEASARNLRRSRHKHMQYLKPLNSIESCLMAQICKQPALRPFVVTDGIRVISRPSFDSCNLQARDETKNAISEISESVFGGIPQLPERRSDSGQRSKECNLNEGKEDHVKKKSSIREMCNKTQIPIGVAPTGAALFCLGVSVGVMYNTLANKTEVVKLKDVLKQTENLVQDLEEELEMKDSLTVNELVSVSDVFPREHESSIDSKKPKVTHFQSDSEVLINVENSDTQRAPKNLDSMNEIEAELEAELERLQLNMKGSTLHTKSSDDDNDEQREAEMMAELIQDEVNCDHSVSPRDLSLRLHQVIQSRLEQRIMELETALEKSQRRVKQLESGQHTHVHVSSSSICSSSSSLSLSTMEAENELPLVMNLSGEALDAYNHAFVELSNINETNYNEIPQKQLSSRSLLELGPTVKDDDAHTINHTTFEQREIFSFDEDDEEEDDDTLFLIRQIVEKTRRGSSAILNAHTAMVSLDG